MFDVIDILVNYEANYVPFSYLDADVNKDVLKARKVLSSYNRVRRQVIDEQDLFVPESLEKVKSPISSVIFSESRLNVSIRFEIYGKVHLNAKSAKRVGLPEFYPAKKYRVHTIIKDGNLNLRFVEFQVSKDCLAELSKVKGLIKESFAVNNENRVVLDLSKVPIVNRSYLESVSVNDISNITHEINGLEINQKVLKHLTVETGEKDEEVAQSSLNPDQVQVLIDSGIAKGGVYSGVKKVPVTTGDFYEAREIKTYVKGFSSLPSISSVINKSFNEKKMNKSDIAIYESLNKLSSLRLIELKNALMNTKSLLLRLRNELSRIKICTVLNHAWFDSIVIDEKGNAELPNGVVMNVIKVKEYL